MLALRPQQRDNPADILDDARLDALGRFVQHQQARLHHQRPRDGELLLLAARQIAAAPAQHRLQHRKQVEDVVRHPTLAARQDGEPGLQILPHRQQRKDVAALRHPGDAAPRALVGSAAA